LGTTSFERRVETERKEKYLPVLASFATELNDAVMSGIPVVDIRIYAGVDSWETQIFTRLGVAPVCRAGPRALVFWTERRLKIDHTPESIMVAVR
jgi:hypothetical protein